MSTEIQFRSFMPLDAEVLPRLFMRATNELYPLLKDDGWIDDLHDIEGSYLRDGGDVRVGIVDGAKIAMGGLKIVERGVAEMKRVAVEPELQGQGIGQALLEDLEERASGLGIVKIVLDTTTKHKKALEMYRNNGYRLVGHDASVQHTSGYTFDTFFFEKVLT